jgi:N-acetylmuramic acid 6-phosphate etherase
MLAYLTGCSPVESERALEQAWGSVKLAVLVLRGCNPRRAETLLQKTNGHLRKAIELFDAEANGN